MKGNQKKCHSKLDLESHHKLLRNNEILNQVQDDRRCGFTLIELLVVVLIIGVLAAIAVPQYQKAVIRSRMIKGLALAKTIGQAMEVYYMENSKNPTKFKDLVVSLPSELKDEFDPNKYTLSTDVYLSDEWKVNLTKEKYAKSSYEGIVYVTYDKGKYRAAGFAYIPVHGVTAAAAKDNAGRIMCVEQFCSNPGIADKFCVPLFKGKDKRVTGCLNWYVVDW